jgi:hypothetical protein
VPRDSPVNISQNGTNIDLSSDSSDSSLHFSRPTCFNIAMWIGCIMTLLFSSLHTVQYVNRCVLSTSPESEAKDGAIGRQFQTQSLSIVFVCAIRHEAARSVSKFRVLLRFKN